ncbi:GNAT family N-acetyltransferase [Paenibacillus pini]|uniref:Acetyltransferase n=1 Tax=Paenibacillus pini JCM 16418 TaxID=1236976 RepID=W7YSG2_9BACL|nr:GNAT family N-acetyltransferase [Paenibacillus pini]GAF10143.1 acetyltransferase [Paenibacillus pini JCM 16418]
MSYNQQTLTIRPSEMKDAQFLMDLDAIVWNDLTAPEPLHWTSREDFLQHCLPGSQLVAVVDGELCGYVGFRSPTSMLSNGHVYEISIAVHPDFQHAGIGMRLMEAAKSWALERGRLKLRLRVLSSNPGAVSFYRKCGFVEEGRLQNEFYIGDQYVDDILMGYLMM